MTSRELFAAFVHDCGGRQKASDALGIGYSMVCHILSGERGISRRIAERAEAYSAGKYSKAALFFGTEKAA